MSDREVWDRLFSQLAGVGGCGDEWLARWRGVLEHHRGCPVLDLGCGAGRDTLYLARLGHRVVATDFSEKALEITRRRVPAAEVQHLDLSQPLPFLGAYFGAVVAGLSLHYFPWAQTVKILEEVRRVLVPGGHLLARLNSTKDPRYAAAEKEEIEKNFYLVNNSPKRLFDRKGVSALFAGAWELVSVEERTTSRYGDEKVLWEVVAKK